MADPVKNRLRVTIGGIVYTLRGDAPAEQLQAVADRVDTMMAQIQKANPQLDQRRAAVLCAINLADELYRLTGQYQALADMLEEQKQSTPGGR